MHNSARGFIAQIPVRVSDGMFAHEANVSFFAGADYYSLLVERADIDFRGRERAGYLSVIVVEQGETESIIDLPRETFTSGRRVRVPNTLLQ